ncbi:MAG: fasciclin domain-containing protein [Bacteroidota bacterium]
MFKHHFLSSLLLVAVFVLGFSSCGDDDDNAVPTTEQTIAEVVAGDPQFSILLQALQQANLDGILGQAGAFTVFAPTDAAFEAAGIDLNTIDEDVLSETLLYHVFGGNVASGDIMEGQTYLATEAETGPNGERLSLLVEKTGASVTLNGDINVMTADVRTNNGVIHIVNKVLSPLNVVGHAQANSNFSTLVQSLIDADGDLVTTLNSPGPFTVFAPTNQEFADIQSTVDELSTANLAKVLLYHVVPNANVTSSTLSAGPVPTANDGAQITISTNPARITDVTGATIDIVATDVQATNGVIHVIGGVLLPDNLD